MREETGDLWEAHHLGYWVTITTNGIVRADGACVMGRGVARQAAERFPVLPKALGVMLARSGNHVYAFHTWRVISFPVKAHWRDRASMSLIYQSATELMRRLALDPGIRPPVYLVRPGCGNGGLRWEDVKPGLAKILDDRVTIIER